MTPNVPPSVPAARPECDTFCEALQRRLDGESFAEPESVRLHPVQCAECRALEEASGVLLNGIKQIERPAPPADFAGRILAQAKSTYHRPTRIAKRLAVWFTLAASILVAVFAVNRLVESNTRIQAVTVRTPPVPRPTPPASVPPLRETLNEAGSMVASLTRKAAGEGLNVKLPDFSLGRRMIDPLENLEPAVTTFQSVGNGAAFSVAPITNTARRAADKFWRELGRGLERKPDAN